VQAFSLSSHGRFAVELPAEGSNPDDLAVTGFFAGRDSKTLRKFRNRCDSVPVFGVRQPCGALDTSGIAAVFFIGNIATVADSRPENLFP